MGGVIVTVVHDEFRGMGLSGVSGLLGAWAVVVDVGGWRAVTAAPAVMSNK
jgi:hypothetical protein